MNPDCMPVERNSAYEVQQHAVEDVLAERRRQEEKWGEQNHDPFTYLTILVEEVGELAQAALHAKFGGHAATKLREEAIHVAAVALAIVECLDRGTWRWPTDEPRP
jgi:NTP pyrophosphatase (non-canonical NTP hydrolase)